MAARFRIKAVLIDPALQSVRETFIGHGLEALQEAVGGMVEIAHEFPNGDVLYVDEEGLLKAQDAILGREDAARAFVFDIGAHQPFAGRGVIVGAEDEDGRHTDARTSAREIIPMVSFMAPAVASAPTGGLPN